MRSRTQIDRYSRGLFLLLGTTLIIAGCDSSVLESTPYGQSTTQNFWRNAADAEAAVNAAYQPVLSLYSHSEHTFDILSDDQWRAGDHGEDQAIEEMTYDPSNAQLAAGWKPKYEMVNRANHVLINVPNIDMDPALKDRILGEAHFLRGFGYWRLSVIYGGVPLILEDQVIANEYNQPRSTRDQIWAQIESDWLKAAELLPATHGGENLGRVTSGTAWGFLTKLYVYQERFSDAINAGEHVINGPYPLADDFNANFRVETENNPEVLFAAQFLNGWVTGNHIRYTTPRPWGGWDFHEPVQDLVDEFGEDDPRLDYSLYKVGDVVDLGGDRGPTEYTADLSQTGYHFRKYSSWRSEGGLDFDHNVPLLRVADVYLLVAEAKIRSGGSGDAEINAVRDRVDLPPVSGADMQDLIHERRVELAGENQRHQDLMRWDKAGIVDIVAIYARDDLHPQNPGLKPPRTFVRPKHYYFAIPQNEIDISNGVLDQSTAWGGSFEDTIL